MSGNAHIGMQIAKKMLTSQKMFALGQVSFNNELAEFFFLSQTGNKSFYTKFFKSGSCTFLGPKKLYVFSSYEKKQLSKLQLYESDGFCFSSCVIFGKIFSSCDRDTTKRVNSIVKINSNLYVISRLICVKDAPHGVLFVKKISCIDHKLSSLSYKVIEISDCIKVFPSNMVQNTKYLCQFDANSKLSIVTAMVNTIELE